MAEHGEPEEKKSRLDAAGIDDDTNGSIEKSQRRRFRNFKAIKVLTENSKSKMICVHGHFSDCDGGDGPKDAVVILEKTPFNEESVNSILSEETDTHLGLQNDIYGTYELRPNPAVNGVKTTLIFPATGKHIAKYTAQAMYMVNETAEHYTNVTLPYISSQSFSIQWVYNILEKKCEADKIVFEDEDPETGFILLPDMKWDGKQKEDLYLVAIVHKHGIKSLRDLGTEHLPLLKNILSKGLEAIKEKYEVPERQLRVYLHYQPSYYHLHVHFTHLKFEAPGSGVERAHLLSDVIENIEMNEKYYQKKTLTFASKEKDGLYQAYVEAGLV